MNRRGFLQAMLAAGMAPALVKAENIMPVFMRRECGLIAPRFMDDLIRTTTAYDLERDLFITRHDIFVPSVQWQLGVDSKAYAEGKSFDSKSLAVELFDKELRHKGLSWADCWPLPPVKVYQ